MTSSIKVFILVNVILLSSLVLIVYYVKKENHNNLLLLTPKQNSFGTSASYSLEDLEEINNKDFMITYDEHKNTIISTLGTNHEVVIRETNFLYPFIFNLQMVSGGFFSNNDQDRAIKNVVLNKQAAFEIFGNFNIVGNIVNIEQDKYTVVGVINDKDEESRNIYLPIMISNNIPTIFMVYFQENNLEFVKNEFNNIGISDANYNFISLGTFSQKNYDKLVIAFGLLSCYIIFLLLNVSIKIFLKQVSSLVQLNKLYYFMNIITQNTVLIIKLIFSSLFIFILCSSLVYVLITFVKIFLRWSSYPSELANYYFVSFSDKISFIQNLDSISNIILISYVICILLCKLMSRILNKIKKEV